MAGAMAGTAIIGSTVCRDTLGTVTLTINNECNLACDHCYLQYSGEKRVISSAVLDAVFASSCDRVCIVGKEPLANRAAIAVVADIVARAERSGKPVSIISNGLNGRLLPAEVAAKLAYIDISLDGGPSTYEQYRRGSWRKLELAVSSLRDSGVTDIRLLQTLSSATVGALDDMLIAHDRLGASVTLVSPFQTTRMQGLQSTFQLSPQAFLSALAPYSANPELLVAVDSLYAGADADGSFERRGRELFGDRFIFVGRDPLDRGLLRVTYDGLVLTPYESVNTQDYQARGRPLERQGLDTMFGEIYKASESRSSLH